MGSFIQGLERNAAINYTGMPATKDEDWAHQIATLMDQGLQPEHTLLEVGAGVLGVGKVLIDYLILPRNYWAVEPNKWLCEASGVPRDKYHLYTFDDFRLSRIKQTFDFVFAHSIFTHADRDQIRTILAEAYKVLVPGGKFIASFFDPHCGDSEHVGWLYPSGVSYTEEFIVGLAQEAGFTTETKLDPRHPIRHTWLFGVKP